MTDPEIRAEVIDLALSKFPHEWSPPERDLMATITAAERELAGRRQAERAESHLRVMSAAYHDPESVAGEIALLNAADEPDMSIYDGLPVTAPEMHALQLTRPWASLEAARAAEIVSAWTPDDMAALERRIGPLVDGGVHWPR